MLNSQKQEDLEVHKLPWLVEDALLWYTTSHVYWFEGRKSGLFGRTLKSDHNCALQAKTRSCAEWFIVLSHCKAPSTYHVYCYIFSKIEHRYRALRSIKVTLWFILTKSLDGTHSTMNLNLGPNEDA